MGAWVAEYVHWSVKVANGWIEYSVHFAVPSVCFSLKGHHLLSLQREKEIEIDR